MNSVLYVVKGLTSAVVCWGAGSQDLADRVDLRINDAFGRNALYYACLCGHASVAHLVAVRAYGGVEVCFPSSLSLPAIVRCRRSHKREKQSNDCNLQLYGFETHGDFHAQVRVLPTTPSVVRGP